MSAIAGSAGLGLVWGWLAASRERSGWQRGVGLLGTALVALEAFVVVGVEASLAAASGAVAGTLLHFLWRARSLRRVGDD